MIPIRQMAYRAFYVAAVFAVCFGVPAILAFAPNLVITIVAATVSVASIWFAVILGIDFADHAYRNKYHRDED